MSERKYASGTGRWPVQGVSGNSPVNNQLRVTRRNLPHWELGGSTYFITYRCVPGIILSDDCRTAVLDNWRYWNDRRYLLHTAVIMPNHLHAILTPLPIGPLEWFALKTILHTNKGYSAHEINRLSNREGSVWQDERYDRIARDEAEFWQKWTYLAENPVRWGLVKEPKEYQWLFQDATAIEKCTGQRPMPLSP